MTGPAPVANVRRKKGTDRWMAARAFVGYQVELTQVLRYADVPVTWVGACVALAEMPGNPSDGVLLIHLANRRLVAIPLAQIGRIRSTMPDPEAAK